MQKDDLEAKFHTLGLNTNEQKVYLETLKAGKIMPARVSKLTGINRTTVYSIGKKLAAMNLVTEDLGGKTSFFIAEDPANLENLVKYEEKELERKKKLARDLAKELSPFVGSQTYSIPRIKVVEEEDLSDYLYSQYMKWAKSGEERDNTWWGYHDHSYTETYGKFIDWSWKKGPKDLKVKFLTNENISEKKMSKKHPNRMIHFCKGLDFDASLEIIGDYVLMVKTRERPHYMIEINDVGLSRNLRELFKWIWEITPKK
jgi:hypothetical protein